MAAGAVLWLNAGTTGDNKVAMRQTVLANARIFDGTNATLHEGLGVLLDGARISAIAPRVECGREATVTDLGGRTLRQGLIDAHYHPYATAVELATAGALKPAALADLVAVDGNQVADIAVLCGQGERIPLAIKNGEILKRLPM